MKYGLILLVLLQVGTVQAQGIQQAPEQRLRVPTGRFRQGQMGAGESLQLRRRLLDLDRLLGLGNLAGAEALLVDLAQHRQLADELVPRRIKLAQLQGDHAKAVRLGREGLASRHGNGSLWRDLAVSLMAVGDLDSAWVAWGQFIAATPNHRSAATISAAGCLSAGHPQLALGLIDSMRTVLQEPQYQSRQRALGLLAVGRQGEAAAEISAELRHNPYNFSIVRTALLDGPYQPQAHGDFLAALVRGSHESASEGSEALLAANLLVAAGKVPAALALVEPLMAQRSFVMVLLQNCATMTRELRLVAELSQVQNEVDYLLGVLEPLIGGGTQDKDLRRRAANNLADVCAVALDLGVLGADPVGNAERFEALLVQVATIDPASSRLYSSQIALAIYRRDKLHEPAAAARELEGMLLNLDLPTAGLALVRLALGESYLADGDTARSRAVLTRLGRDTAFHEAGGRAHYLLAQLDLVEGYYATARDRFAVIALDNPKASYANEALDLGLIIAEEMDNPTGGPDILALYAPVVYASLSGRPDQRLTALERFIKLAGARLDMEEPQHLYEKALFELAVAYADHGRVDEALPVLKRIVLEHPAGRYPARALHRRGEWLLAAGRGQAARVAWEQLLVQYPDYLFMDDVRDSLQELTSP